MPAHLKIVRDSQEMQPHPAAEIFPLMMGADFEALVADIREHGQREPIVVHDGLILDGRNRYRACRQLGIKADTLDWNGGGAPETFVISMNLHRRHLNDGQRAMIAAKFATLIRGQKKANTPIGASQEEAAERFGVSHRNVQRASVIKERAVPELAQAVADGDIPVSAAAQVAHLPKERQQQIAAGGKKAVAKAAKQMRIKKASRSTAKKAAVAAPKETQHDRDLRWLRETWAATCESAHAVFLKEVA